MTSYRFRHNQFEKLQVLAKSPNFKLPKGKVKKKGGGGLGVEGPPTAGQF